MPLSFTRVAKRSFGSKGVIGFEHAVSRGEFWIASFSAFQRRSLIGLLGENSLLRSKLLFNWPLFTIMPGWLKLSEFHVGGAQLSKS